MEIFAYLSFAISVGVVVWLSAESRFKQFNKRHQKLLDEIKKLKFSASNNSDCIEILTEHYGQMTEVLRKIESLEEKVKELEAKN